MSWCRNCGDKTFIWIGSCFFYLRTSDVYAFSSLCVLDYEAPIVALRLHRIIGIRSEATNRTGHAERLAVFNRHSKVGFRVRRCFYFYFGSRLCIWRRRWFGIWRRRRGRFRNRSGSRVSNRIYRALQIFRTSRANKTICRTHRFCIWHHLPFDLPCPFYLTMTR